MAAIITLTTDFGLRDAYDTSLNAEIGDEVGIKDGVSDELPGLR